MGPIIYQCGIDDLCGPCYDCKQYYKPDLKILVKPDDRYDYNPGHNEEDKDPQI